MNSTVRLTLLCAATLFLLGLPATSSTKQNRKDSEIVQVEVYSSHESIHPEGSFGIAIIADIKPGFHINSHNPTDKFLVPTVVRFDEEEGITLSPVSYPVPEFKSFSFSTSKASVYEGKIPIFSHGRLSNDIPPGDVKVSGILDYQACNDQTCFMPMSVGFEIPLKVVNTDKPIKLINKHIFEQKASLTPDELHAKQVIEKGLIYAVIAFFLFGLALNLTPCVYPVIPITVSFFGAQSERKKVRTFVLALYYVAGIAIVFSILGLISALAGRQWGFLFQSPWFVICVTIIVLSMAASMFGAFEITVPSSLMTYAGKSRQGAIGSFVMGLTVGVIIAPCAAGIIIGLVGIVAKLGMVAKGTLLFFVMGLGLGVPYIFLAMSSGLLSRLPKSGVWMVWIRKLFGVLLIGVALYFLVPQAKQASDQQGFYLGVLGIFGGLLLGFLEHGEGYSRAFKIVRAIFGCLLILAGVFLVDRALQRDSGAINWINYDNQSIEQLRSENKPVLIDFYADWCAACKELDRKTFSDKRIVEKSKEFTMVRVDATSPDSKRTHLIRKFKISGLPTVVFMSAKGEELNSLKITGFLKPAEMIRRMEDAMGP
ncbi:MAG: thioredoxin family protein [Proteobacteria bacterium]|nr:thioredoxin family protein [Pseudomonadota bacterium]